MPAPTPKQVLVAFGLFEADLRSGELRKQGRRIPLQEKPFQILALLLENAGQVVTREELRARLWPPDVFVDFDHSLNSAIAKLREALSDSNESPLYVETVSRRGYRFLASVQNGATTQPQPLAARPRVLRFALLAAVPLLVAVLAVVAAVWVVRGGKGSAGTAAQPGTPSIAVLPFVNMSSDKEQEYFSDGLAEELRNDLAKVPGLRVAARTSSSQFKGKSEDLRTVGEKLNVDTILEGSVRKEGKKVRITAQLIKVADGFHLWSETYDRELSDIFAVQDDIARSVAGSLKLALLGGKTAQSKNAEAYNAYLQGQYFLERYDLDKAIGYHEQAVNQDPGYALAWVGLAVARFEHGDYPKSREAVDRALALDANLAEANATSGWLKMAHDWDWAGADASFRRALFLAPENGKVIQGAAALAGIQGNFEQAVTLNRRAVELDPLSLWAYYNLGNSTYCAGRLEEAAAAFKKVLELNPEDPGGTHEFLGLIYLAQAHPQQALAEFEREKEAAARLQGQALAYHALGRTKQADAALASFIQKYPVEAAAIAQVYSVRGEIDRAFEWLDRAYARHDGNLVGLKGDPLLKNLRHDPRYVGLLKKMRLPF